jgi:hypothetical protein
MPSAVPEPGPSDAEEDDDPVSRAPRRARRGAKPRAAVSESDDEDAPTVDELKHYLKTKTKKWVAKEFAAAVAAMQAAQEPAPQPAPVHSAYRDVYALSRANLLDRVNEKARADVYATIFPGRRA